MSARSARLAATKLPDPCSHRLLNRHRYLRNRYRRKRCESRRSLPFRCPTLRYQCKRLPKHRSNPLPFSRPLPKRFELMQGLQLLPNRRVCYAIRASCWRVGRVKTLSTRLNLPARASLRPRVASRSVVSTRHIPWPLPGQRRSSKACERIRPCRLAPRRSLSSRRPNCRRLRGMTTSFTKFTRRTRPIF